MKRVIKLLYLTVLALSLTAFSQAQTTTITASRLKISGYPISMGEVLITPVNSQGTPIPFADATGAQNGPESFACQIVAGAITGAISETGTVSGTCSVPDAAETTPANILYSFQVVDQSSGLKTSGDAYTIQAVIGVSGTSWALDHYGPPATTTNVAAVQASQGTSIPTSCTSPSVFTLLTGGGTFSGFYTCVGGVEVAVSGGNGAVSSVFGRTGGVTAQTGDYTVAQITGAAPLASPTFTGTPTVPGYDTTAHAATLAPLTGAGASGTWGISITGTAANLSGTPALPNGTTGTTQSVGDNSTKLATDAFVIANAGSGGSTSFSGLTGAATPSQLPAATSSAQGAVQLPSGAGSNVLGSAAMTSSTAYDAFGSATTAATTAEAYSANATHLNTGTVPLAQLPGAGVTTINGTSCTIGTACTPTNTLLTIKGSDSPETLAADFKTIENYALSNNVTSFSDGTVFVKAAGTNVAYANFFISDNVLTAMQYPAFFTPATELSWARKTIAAATSGTGYLPYSLTSAAAAVTTPDQFTNGGTLAGYIGDGWIFTPIAEWLYWAQTGDVTKFTTDATAIELAFSNIPTDSTTGLVKITAGSEWVPWLYLEVDHPTGDVADGSVWYAYDARLMAQMYTAAGNTARATYWTGIYNTVTASLVSTLTNSTNGMLYAGQTQTHQIDNVSSALAVYLEELPAAQETLISQYLVTNIAPGASTPYSALISYPVGAVVSSGGSFYTSVIPSNVGNALSLTADWTLTPAYAAGTTYALGAAVSYGGAVFTSQVAGNVGNTPSSSSTYWSQFVSSGFVRNSPADFLPSGCTSTGGTPYTATPCYGAGTNTYQDAYWGYANGFYEYAMAKTNLASAKLLAEAQRFAPDPTEEWIYSNGTSGGNTPNSTTSDGSFLWTSTNNAATFFPVGGACFHTLYGVCNQNTNEVIGATVSNAGATCVQNGVWSFNQDGTATVCAAGLWVTQVAAPTAATYLNTTFSEGAAAAVLAGTTPVISTATTGASWALASGTGFTYSGSNSVTTSTANTVPELINTGQANETIRVNLTACSPGASICNFWVRGNTASNFISVNVYPTYVSVYDVVAGTATLKGTITGAITGLYTITLNGTAVTFTGPESVTPLTFTTGTPSSTYFGMLLGAAGTMTVSSLSAKAF